MRRIQIHMDDDLDRRLEQEAAETGTSKAAIIRSCVAARYAPVEHREPFDPIGSVIGAFDGDPVDDIDDVIYG